MKKRIISLLLTLALAFTLVPAAFADKLGLRHLVLHLLRPLLFRVYGLPV